MEYTLERFLELGSQRPLTRDEVLQFIRNYHAVYLTRDMIAPFDHDDDDGYIVSRIENVVMVGNRHDRTIYVVAWLTAPYTLRDRVGLISAIANVRENVESLQMYRNKWHYYASNIPQADGTLRFEHGHVRWSSNDDDEDEAVESEESDELPAPTGYDRYGIPVFDGPGSWEDYIHDSDNDNDMSFEYGQNAWGTPPSSPSQTQFTPTQEVDSFSFEAP